MGTISGAIKGQTTETGFLRGSGIGAVAGAITAVQLMELRAHGEPFSKVLCLALSSCLLYYTLVSYNQIDKVAVIDDC